MIPSPGYTTTEFWQTLLSQLIAIATLLHIGVPANTPAYVQAIALLASGISIAFYTHSRQQVKVAAFNAVSTPQQAPQTPIAPSTLPSV